MLEQEGAGSVNSFLNYTTSMNQEILLISSGKQHLMDIYFSCHNIH